MTKPKKGGRHLLFDIADFEGGGDPDDADKETGDDEECAVTRDRQDY